MSELPKGQSQEVSPNRNLPGVYEHPVTKVRITCYPGKRADAQADAYVQVGFKRVGDCPSLAEIAEADAKQSAKDKAEKK